MNNESNLNQSTLTTTQNTQSRKQRASQQSNLLKGTTKNQTNLLTHYILTLLTTAAKTNRTMSVNSDDEDYNSSKMHRRWMELVDRANQDVDDDDDDDDDYGYITYSNDRNTGQAGKENAQLESIINSNQRRASPMAAGTSTSTTIYSRRTCSYYGFG
jgi:hypothetical protein